MHEEHFTLAFTAPLPPCSGLGWWEMTSPSQSLLTFGFQGKKRFCLPFPLTLGGKKKKKCCSPSAWAKGEGLERK